MSRPKIRAQRVPVVPAAEAPAATKAQQIENALHRAMDERFRLGHAASLLKLVGDCVGTPCQVDHMSDMELQERGLTVEYLADLVEEHAAALGEALSQLEALHGL